VAAMLKHAAGIEKAEVALVARSPATHRLGAG
jgi:hypothetical protein